MAGKLRIWNQDASKKIPDMVLFVQVSATYTHTYKQHVLFPPFHTAGLLKKYGTHQFMPPNNQGYTVTPTTQSKLILELFRLLLVIYNHQVKLAKAYKIGLQIILILIVRTLRNTLKVIK